ncbi:MAG: 30S ribosomal protein S6, partial [Chloroflexi bacterium]|nr:30S ribosomal protein S6 [Chloroflexota bacterium]
LDEDGVNGVTERVTQVITQNKGEVTKVDVWGRRRLAYPIKNHREGTYVLLHARLSSAAIPEMDRMLKLSEDVIRHLFTRTDEE